MTSTILFPQAPDLDFNDYCVFGLATCFVREDGEILTVEIFEPIPSAALEALLKGIPTSYHQAIATTLGAVFTGETITIPPEFPPTAKLGEQFTERAIAATRTYKKAISSQSHIPLGTIYDKFNHSTQKKRVLNLENIVTTEDNVKQHSYTHQVL